MNWTKENIEELKELCRKSVPNAELASHFNVPVTEIYAKRSQLGITRAKCAGKDDTVAKEERLLKAIFGKKVKPVCEPPEIPDNYPETFIDKVCYSECILYHTIAEITPALHRLNRLHNLLAVSEKDGENKLPDIITNNESRMALKHLLQVQNDINEVCGYVEEIYKATEGKNEQNN